MNPGIDYYRPFGQPATGWLRFDTNLAAGDTVTVGGTNYVAGTDFQVGDGNAITAQNFAAAVNSDRNKYGVLPSGYHNEVLPIRTYYAIFYGTLVLIVATMPGTAGHAISLVGVTNKVVASGLFLTGGSSYSIATTPPAIASALLVTWTDYARAGTGSAIALAAASTLARSAYAYAPSANPANITFGPTSACRITLIPGMGWTLPGHDGTAFDLNSWFFTGAVGNSIVVFYAS